MLTPISEILEEFTGDIAQAYGTRWQYQFREKMLDPTHGLYIDIARDRITIHGRVNTDDIIFSDSYERRGRGEPDWDIVGAGLIYFYRLMGQWMCPNACLARYSVDMTQGVLRWMQDSSNVDGVITLSFKGDQSWYDTVN